MAAAPSQAPAPSQLPGIMQQQTDPLAELRDIHMPAPIEVWPPAPGWWLLAIIAALAVLAGLFWLYRRWRSNRYRREALAELRTLMSAWQEHGDDHRYLTELQALLKRTALTSFPREEVASLTGEAWVAFLDHSTGTHEFSMGDAEVLIDGNYNPNAKIYVENVHSIAEHWIRKHHSKHLKDFAETHVEPAIAGGAA